MRKYADPSLCTCTPGARCERCALRSCAVGLLLAVAPDRRKLDAVTYWDRRTSLADARTGLCLAAGVPVEQINPASGHRHSGWGAA